MPQEIIEKFKNGDNPILVDKNILCAFASNIGVIAKKGYGLAYYGVPVFAQCLCLNGRTHECEEYNPVGDKLSNY